MLQGSMLCLSLFLFYTNDLLPSINAVSAPVIFAGDASVLIAEPNIRCLKRYLYSHERTVRGQ
jgi:hypothetical protein